MHPLTLNLTLTLTLILTACLGCQQDAPRRDGKRVVVHQRKPAASYHRHPPCVLTPLWFENTRAAAMKVWLGSLLEVDSLHVEAFHVHGGRRSHSRS